jgi:hypothetical protein
MQVPGLQDSRFARLNVSQGVTMRTFKIVLASFLVVGFSSAAVAQPKAKETKPKVKVYDFSGDTIEGDLIRPEGTTVDARDFSKHSSLIRIRKEFIDAILKSAEDL